MFTSWSDMSTPPELSMASVLSRPPRVQYSRRARWVRPRLPPSPMTRARTAGRIDADAIVGAVADVGVLLGRRLHVGADAAVVEQIDLRARGWPESLPRRWARSSSMPSSARASALSGISFADRSKMPPPALIADAS